MNNTTSNYISNHDVAVGLYVAIAGNDFASAAQYLAPDVVLHVPGTHPLAGDHRGPEAFARFVESTRSLTTDGEQIELLDLLEGHDHVAAYCRVTAQRPGREPLDNTTVHLMRVREGRVTEAWLHNWDGPAVDRFWS